MSSNPEGNHIDNNHMSSNPKSDHVDNSDMLSNSNAAKAACHRFYPWTKARRAMVEGDTGMPGGDG